MLEYPESPLELRARVEMPSCGGGYTNPAGPRNIGQDDFIPISYEILTASLDFQAAGWKHPPNRRRQGVFGETRGTDVVHSGLSKM